MYKIKFSEDLYEWAKETRCLQKIPFKSYEEAEKEFVSAFGYDYLDQPFGGTIEQL